MVKEFEKTQNNMLKEIERYEKTSKKLNPILVKKYITYIEWMYLVFLYNHNEMKDSILSYVHNKKDIIKNTKIEEHDNRDIIEELENTEIEDEELKEIAKTLEQKYKYLSSTTIPTKTSVTEIKRKAIGEKEEEQSIFNQINNKQDVQIKFDIPKFLDNEEKYINGATKGTLIHLCMQNLDLKKEYTLNDVKQMVEKLQVDGLINEVEKMAININKIYNFTKNKLWKNMQDAKLVEREKPFYMNIPARDIYKIDVEENILTQGILDVYYIDKNDNLILLDYKTDYVQNEEELKNKYKLQLELYKRALEDALNRRVSKTYLYSTHLDKEIEL
ncbi:ATP-dependent helicase/nuclease subunit A [compost metagenome]